MSTEATREHLPRVSDNSTETPPDMHVLHFFLSRGLVAISRGRRQPAEL